MGSFEKRKKFLKEREKEFDEFLDEEMEGGKDSDVRLPKQAKKDRKQLRE